MPRVVKSLIRRLTRTVSLDVVRYDPRSHPLARRMRLLAGARIDTVLDIGANSGQYAQELRSIGYRGRIISFEPQAAAFAALQRNQAKASRKWDVVNMALGDRAGQMSINVAENSVSSSLLQMLPGHLRSAPESRTVAQEVVGVATVDSIMESIDRSARIFLKSDTQGYESRVLAGAAASLARILGIQVEMSIVPLYEGEMLVAEIIQYLAARGFTLMSIEPGFADPSTGRLLQIDGVFFRQSALS